VASSSTPAMQFNRERLTVNGVDIVMLTAGSGAPLMYWHGAGTWHGFDFALQWATNFRVMIPYHPGWGESDDGPGMDTVSDYMVHYLELLDRLGIDRTHLVGSSMGGRLAATFACEHRDRIHKLVLISPAGLNPPESPMVSHLPPEEIPNYLVEDVSILKPHLVNAATAEFQAARTREGGNFFKLLESGLVGPKFARWLHRLTMPTLLVWGEKDRLLPFGQAGEWMKLLPNARLERVPGVGHLVPDESPEATAAIAKFLAA
jgi:pimeloyl-ACP methyl ester carboxylesterase